MTSETTVFFSDDAQPVLTCHQHGLDCIDLSVCTPDNHLSAFMNTQKHPPTRPVSWLCLSTVLLHTVKATATSLCVCVCVCVCVCACHCVMQCLLCVCLWLIASPLMFSSHSVSLQEVRGAPSATAPNKVSALIHIHTHTHTVHSFLKTLFYCHRCICMSSCL